LKYGDEKVMLEKASRVFDDLFVVVKQASFEWDGFKARIERDAEMFWRE
jgi:hypothetical protein